MAFEAFCNLLLNLLPTQYLQDEYQNLSHNILVLKNELNQYHMQFKINKILPFDKNIPDCKPGSLGISLQDIPIGPS
jgi:hypothetical protein